MGSLKKTPDEFYCLRCGWMSYLVDGLCAGCGSEINLSERMGEAGRRLRTQRVRDRIRNRRW